MKLKRKLREEKEKGQKKAERCDLSWKAHIVRYETEAKIAPLSFFQPFLVPKAGIEPARARLIGF